MSELLAFAATCPIIIVAVSSIRFFHVTTSSMAPTLRAGDRILVCRSIWRVRPKRDEIIVFRDRAGGAHPRPRHLVKRVTAVAGDEVMLMGSRIRVPARMVFVMGDNVEVSRDSRDFGCVHSAAVTGKALVVAWPPKRIGLLRRSC